MAPPIGNSIAGSASQSDTTTNTNTNTDGDTDIANTNVQGAEDGPPTKKRRVDGAAEEEEARPEAKFQVGEFAFLELIDDNGWAIVDGLICIKSALWLVEKATWSYVARLHQGSAKEMEGLGLTVLENILTKLPFQPGDIAKIQMSFSGEPETMELPIKSIKRNNTSAVGDPIYVPIGARPDRGRHRVSSRTDWIGETADLRLSLISTGAM
jgi:hypothetical protein